MTAFPVEPLQPLSAAPAPRLTYAFERPQDGALVDALVDRAFGPGRFAKAAERLRERNHPRLELSICAWAGDRLVGAARQWPVLIGDHPAVFLGPFAVDPAFRSQGVGAELIRRAAAAADAAGEPVVLLVGDEAYFGALGFHPVERGRVTLPGPVDARRILWRGREPAALEGLGGPVTIPREA